MKVLLDNNELCIGNFGFCFGIVSLKTNNSCGNVLTFCKLDSYWYKQTYDSCGNRLSYLDSNCYWRKWAYNNKNEIVNYLDSSGYSFEYFSA